MPVIYDTTSKQKLGTVYSYTKTKWIYPPYSDTRDNYRYINKWISKNEHNINITGMGMTGASKTCYINDINTVFKYNDNLSRFGNQIKREIKIYTRFYTEFNKILPRIYSHGTFWMIEERLILLNKATFYKITKILYYRWKNLIHDIKLPKYSKHIDILTILKNQIKKEHTWIYTNKNLLSIIYFCYKSGTEIEDMAIYNLGKTKKGNNIKIIDYGLKNNRKIESQ